MANAQMLKMNNERFSVPEILFNPTNIGQFEAKQYDMELQLICLRSSTSWNCRSHSPICWELPCIIAWGFILWYLFDWREHSPSELSRETGEGITDLGPHRLCPQCHAGWKVWDMQFRSHFWHSTVPSQHVGKAATSLLETACSLDCLLLAKNTKRKATMVNSKHSKTKKWRRSP